MCSRSSSNLVVAIPEDVPFEYLITLFIFLFKLMMETHSAH